MINEEKLFGNFFHSPRISNNRLYNFGGDTVQRLTAANGGGDYQDLLDMIIPLINTLGLETGQVDVALAQQKGKTLTNDQVLAAFKLTMSTKEGVIADALGGESTPAFLEFYPRGLSEYSNATKTQMPVLTNRVKAAANAHSAALGAPLTTLLTGYVTSWTNSRSAQELQMGTVDDNRIERSDARTAVELGLLTCVHTIGAKFPGNVAACSAFFAFNLLFHHGHRHIIERVDVLAPNAISVAANKSFSDDDGLDIKNTDDNTTIIAYLSPTADGEPGEKFITLKANQTKKPKPSDLGDLSHPFLLIKNTSAINEGSYRIKIKGAPEDEGE